MKREELKELGLSDEQLSTIMTKHGKALNEATQKVQQAESERDAAMEQLASNQAELDSFKSEAQGNDELTAKLNDLQAKYDQAKEDSQNKLSEQSKEFSIKLALKEAEVLDDSIVLGLIDRDTIKVTENGIQGLGEQLEQLKENKPFLFQQETKEEKAIPKMVHSGNPQTNSKKDYDISKMSYDEVVKLKQEQPEVFKNLT